MQNLKVIVEQVMKQERQARKYLTKDAITLEDRIYRSYGILTIDGAHVEGQIVHREDW